eukprot:TRINITY_DN81578_c0_g1_i1.p1 TRINITY_DN81578_c0_g1~~TRINITY_DN81578_c0_g1_i1.p1  ORF type:complete len:528 (-),score=152.65 TRINITY_DN81578_c0_g1_i1:151-1734(-)
MEGVRVLRFLQYSHVLNTNDGTVRVECGPKRVVLLSHESFVSGILESLVVNEDQYAVIENPYDEAKKRYLKGDRRVIEGPAVISLYPNENIPEGIQEAYVLRKNEAIVLETIQDTEDLKAGERRRLVGECRYIPTKFERVLSRYSAIRIETNQGIYVRDQLKSEVRLVTGPQMFLLGAQEELYQRTLDHELCAALGIRQKPTYWAVSMSVNKNEVICIQNFEEKSESYLMGPGIHILGPYETFRVIHLSGGKPKRNNVLHVVKVMKGPSFFSDILEVSTKDNGQLLIHLTYKWEFLVDEDELSYMFASNDFVGYACQTLMGDIREIASKYDFEELHNATVKILREHLFKHSELDGGKVVHGKYFPLNRLLVSEVDVKAVMPVNQEIQDLLSDSIKSNMSILCKKLEQQADLSAKKERMAGEREIQTLKESLIDVQNRNLRLSEIEAAKIESGAQVVRGEYEKEARMIEEEGSWTLEKERLDAYADVLSGDGGDLYLEFVRATQLASVPQSWIVASDQKMRLPLTDES